MLMAPMATAGEEATGSMGNDSPLAVTSDRDKPLFNYFRQLFAQVTNPPIDPIREQLVMSLVSFVGPKPNLLDVNNINPPMRLEVSQPVLDVIDMAVVRNIDRHTSNKFKSHELDICYPVAWGRDGIEARLASLCAEAVDAVKSGFNILIVSDRKIDRDHVAIPALLATSAVHRPSRRARPAHVDRPRRRDRVGARGPSLRGARGVRRGGDPSVSRDGDAGRDACGPARRPVGREGDRQLHEGDRQGPDEGHVEDGHLDLHVVLRRADLRGGRPVAVARRPVLHAAPRRSIEGIDVFDVAEEAIRLHRRAFGDDPVLADMLDAGGEYAYRTRGEAHMWTPDTIAKLQHATRGDSFATYKEYATLINDQSKRLMTLRGLFEFKVDPAKAIPIHEVEPAVEIVKRFATGAMSLGSISTEAHATLAVAMNRIGGKSNTGEGGEDPARYENELKGIPIAAGDDARVGARPEPIVADVPLQAGDSLRSKIKQVASGRFGVTAEYLQSADQIQIKMAQGAKPGEGGQLPGHKVSRVHRASCASRCRASASSRRRRITTSIRSRTSRS